MTLEEVYNSINKFTLVAQKHALINNIVNLKNAVTNLKNWKGTATNPNVAQQILQTRSKLDEFKNAVVKSINDTKSELISLNQYDDIYEEIIGGKTVDLVSIVGQNIDINNDARMNEIDFALTKILSVFNFNSAVADAYTQFDIKKAEIPQGDTLSIIYENDALIDDLKGLNKASDDWNFIIHSFGRLINENDTKAEVLSVLRGSLIITILSVSGIIGAIAKSSNLIMDSVLKALSIKQKVLELRRLIKEGEATDLDNLEKKATIKMNVLAIEITTKLMEEYQSDPKNENYKEIESFVRRSVKRMIVFNSKGGKLEPKIISSTLNEMPEINELKNKNKEFKNLQDSINQIEAGKHTLLLEGNIEDEDIKNNQQS